jgi:hypothetical protein
MGLFELRLRLVAGLSVAALVALCIGFVGGASAGIAGTASFTDPAGDALGGPDITGVKINGDPATGQISVSATLPGFPLAVTDGLERYVSLWLDTDRNRATGDPEDGTEFGLEAWVDPTGRWWNAERWNGSTFEEVPGSTASFSRTGDVLTWTVSTSELGATSFRFYVLAGTWSEAEQRSTTRDEAPGSDRWEYDISASSTTPPPPSTPPKSTVGLIVDRPTASPKAPIAGKPFAVSFKVTLQKTQTTLVFDLATGETREDLITTWQPLARGKAVATPTAGSKPIRYTASIKAGVLRVSMLIPKAAKGKLLRVPVKVTATDSGKTVSKSKVVSFRIK